MKKVTELHAVKMHIKTMMQRPVKSVSERMMLGFLVEKYNQLRGIQNAN